MKDLGQAHTNLGDLVADEIRDAILSGALPPGGRLKQEALAEDLNVSRIPVREALRILEGEGLIENTPGRGSRVVKITARDAADVLTVRGALEGLAARLAAARATSDDIGRFTTLIEEGRAATGAGDHAAASELHARFHLELAKVGGNTYLYDELEALPAKTEWIVSSLLQTRGAFSWDEHAAIADAVAAGEADLAEDLMRQHSEKVIAEFSEDDGTAESGS
jgi:DNA-binding GntR family transcriptional regulator